MNIKKRKSLGLLVLSTVLLSQFSQGFAAKIYQWTDEDGGIHYADKPDAKNTAETIDIYTPKPSSSAPKSTASSTKTGDEADNDKAKTTNSVEEYCKKLGENIKNLETKKNVTFVDNEGNKTQLSSDDQKEKLESYKKDYQDQCSGN